MTTTLHDTTSAVSHGPAARSRRAGGRDVLFLGTHGQHNIGDELLLATFLDQLGPRHRYRVNSYDPDATRAGLTDFRLETFHTTGDRLALVRHLRRCDVVVFGGGSIVKELGPTTGRNRHATLAMLLVVVTLARALGKPVLMSNVGVGPITTRLGRRLAAAVLRRTTLVSVRDEASHRLCVALGCEPERVCRVPDAVWANDATDFALGSTRAPRTDATLRIGLNLNRDIAVPDRWPAFLTELREAITIVAAHRPVQIVGLPMQTGFKRDDDREMLDTFLSTLEEVPSTIVEASDQHDIARALMSCDVVVAERLHCLVMAAILGRPAVALCYDPKVVELADQLQLERASVDVNRPFRPSALASMIGTEADDPHAGPRLAEHAARRRAEVVVHFSRVRRWIDRRGDARRWRDLRR